MVVRVGTGPAYEVRPELFGQFMEIASWGEPGPEGFVDPQTGRLPDAVVEALKQMHASVVRFPGGTDVEHLPWTDRILHAPDRDSVHPPEIREREGKGEVSNRFLWPAFMDLMAELEAEALPVVPMGRAALGEEAVAAAVLRARQMAAYFNGDPADPDLDDALRPWAAARVKSGHAEPHGVRTWQVGNEVYAELKQNDFWDAASGTAEHLAKVEHLATLYREVADGIREVTPEAELIIDGRFADWDGATLLLSHPDVASRYRYAAIHPYAPWGNDTLVVHGTQVDAALLPAELLHYFCVSLPSDHDGFGNTLAIGPKDIDRFTGMGYELVCTEWNWNGWGRFDRPFPHVTAVGRALGAAGFLNGLIRQGRHIKLATQSMMLGTSWNIAGLRGEPGQPDTLKLSPMAQATAFYAANHGDTGLPTVAGNRPAELELDIRYRTGHLDRNLGLLDVVATREGREGTTRVHAINRAFDEPLTLELHGLPSGAARHLALVPVAEGSWTRGDPVMEQRELDAPERVDGGVVRVTLPARSVSVIRVD